MSEALGPIDLITLTFPDQAPTGAVAVAVMDAVEAGVIRLYDIVAVRKSASGEVSALELTDLDGDGELDLAVFAGARSGLLDDDDNAELAAEIDPGTLAVTFVFENSWATGIVAAAHGEGGRLAHAVRIPAEDIIERLDALDGEG